MKSKLWGTLIRIAIIVLSFTITVGIEFGLVYLILKIKLPNTAKYWVLGILIGMLCILVLFIIVNKICFIKSKNKYKDNRKFLSNMNEIEDKYKEIQKDYLASEKEVMKLKNRIILSKILISLYFMIMAFLCALGIQENGEDSLSKLFIILIVVFMFLSPFFWVDLLLPNKETYENYTKELSPKEYKELYKVVEEAIKTLNCHKAFKIYPVFGSSMSVSSSANCIHIYMDCEETALLTRDEIYQSMLHEIAHVLNSDTKRSRSLVNFIYAMEHFGFATTQLFFSSMYVKFIVHYTIYSISCTRFYEELADEEVKKNGNGQAYINGLSKSMLLGLYRGAYNPKMDFDVYANETIPENFYFKRLDDYYEMLPQNIRQWDFILRNRILSRQDSHPTFAMRMKHMGVETYDYTSVQPQGAFAEEQQKLLKLGSEKLMETQESFKHAQESFYKPTKEKLEEYFSHKENKDILTNQQKTEYLSFLFHANREECLKLCDEILKEFSKNSYANFYKGLILADQLDRNCVEHLYIAARENFNLTEDALAAVGNFACNVGDEQLLESYRSRSKEDIVGMMDKQDKFSLHSTENFTKNSLNETEFKEILDYILEVGKEDLLNVYSVSRLDGEEVLTSYLLEWKIHSDFQRVHTAYDKIFSYLDRYGDGGEKEYHFELRHIMVGIIGYDKESSAIVKKIKQTKDSLIYSSEEVEE